MSLPTRAVIVALIVVSFIAPGCDRSWQQPLAAPAVNLTPASQPAGDGVALDRSQIQPMYRELLAVDLPTVTRLVEAKSIDILSSRQRVEASHGQFSSSVGRVFPVLVPGVVFDFHQGAARAVQGQIVTANFTSLSPTAAIQWVVNPGQVAYDIIASKKRLEASQQDELSVRVRVLEQAAIQYYELCLAQTTVAAAREAEQQADELVRTTGLKLQAGRAVPADDLRARAAQAGRRQDLLLALNQFYHASVALATTLHLDSSVTLVPRPDKLTQVAIVRADLSIDQLLALAVENRPDLKSVRQRVAAADADKVALAWGGLGPTGAADYQAGGIGSRAGGQSFPMRGVQTASAGVGWRLGLSTPGDLQSADARRRLADLEADAQYDQLRAEVVQATQDSITGGKLIPISAEQLESAEEGLRQINLNFAAGRAIQLDVLDAQNTLAQSRLRYAQAVVRFNQSQVRILGALGLLTAESLSGRTGLQAATIPVVSPLPGD